MSPFQSPSPLAGKDFLPSPSPNGNCVPDGASDLDKSPKSLSMAGAQRRKKGLTQHWGVNGGSRSCSRHLTGGDSGRAGRGRAEHGIDTQRGTLTSGGPASGDWKREDETRGVGGRR